MVHLQPTLDKIKAKLAGWQGRLLTAGGRRELVRSVLSFMPIYLLTALQVPKSFLKELDKSRRRFPLGGGSETPRGKMQSQLVNNLLANFVR